MPDVLLIEESSGIRIMGQRESILYTVQVSGTVTLVTVILYGCVHDIKALCLYEVHVLPGRYYLYRK
jgi:hypothetical protein